MTKYTPEEIKNRLSNIGEAIGSIALEYIVELEKENEQSNHIRHLIELQKQKQEMECNKMYSTIIEELKKKNEQLKAQIEKMKCCKNCKKYRMSEGQVPFWCLKSQGTNFCCEDWELAE